MKFGYMFIYCQGVKKVVCPYCNKATFILKKDGSDEIITCLKCKKDFILGIGYVR